MDFHLTPPGLGAVYPSLPRDGEASFNASHGPPNSLLSTLETVLGLSGRFVDGALRAAKLVPAVRSGSGFFSRSAEADPLGVAARLIEWRDTLWMQGWRAEPTTPRMRELAAVTLDVEPGVPDRLLAVEAALRDHDVAIARLFLYEPRTGLPWLWRQVVGVLEDRGTEVIDPSSTAAAQPNARVELLRPPGPREAADLVAGWLAAQDDWQGTVVIGGDAVLDHALRRHGLPSLGVREAGDRPVAAVLRLALSLGWHPSAPQRAFELLSLRDGPVPNRLAGRLLGALHDWPAVASDRWNAELSAGLQSIVDAKRRTAVERRLEVLFESTAHSEYPVELARRKAEAVASWAQGRRGDAYGSLLRVARRFIDLLATAPGPNLTEPELEQLLAPAEAPERPAAACRAEAGLVSVAHPGGVLGPAKRVVWWSFSRDRVPRTRPELPLYVDEVSALRKAGVRLGLPADHAALEAQRWRRPLEHAQAELLLVCPNHGADGEALQPHPLWDELSSTQQAGATRATTVSVPTLGTGLPVLARAPATPVSAQRSWTVRDAPAARRDGDESPSSLELLVGCNLAYALKYLARVRPSALRGLPEGALLLGNLSHQILGDALAKAPGASGDAVATAVIERFDSEGPRLASALFEAGAEAERSKVRGVLERSSRALVEWLQERGVEVLDTERAGTCAIGDRTLRGRADVLVGRPGSTEVAGVVDLKWGSASRHQQALESGTSVQLASYGRAFGELAGVADAAYFILGNARALAMRDADVLPGSLDGPELTEVWEHFEQSVVQGFASLESGRLEAPGNPDADGQCVEASQSTAEGLVLAPKCGFCDFASLCGRRFGSPS